MQDLANFIKQFPLREFAKGESMPAERFDKPVLYGIQSGFAKVYALSSAGEEQFVWIAGRLDVVPSEMLFSSRAADEFFYSALTDVAAYEIDKKSFLDFASNNLAVMREIARSMSQHYDDLLMQVRATEQSSAREKLIHTLHSMAMRFSAESTVAFHNLGLMLTHQDIGKLTGLTRETTALEMKKLKDEGYIDYTRSTLIVYTEKIGSLL